MNLVRSTNSTKTTRTKFRGLPGKKPQHQTPPLPETGHSKKSRTPGRS